MEWNCNGVIACFANRIADGFDSHILHQSIIIDFSYGNTLLCVFIWAYGEIVKHACLRNKCLNASGLESQYAHHYGCLAESGLLRQS